MKIANLLSAAALAVAAPTLCHAAGGVTFLINGDTLSRPFSFTNTSTAGERITGFGFDLSTIQASRKFIFDTSGTSSTPFAALGGTGLTTGLVGSPRIPDEASFFQLSFTDFDVDEAFRFQVDIDRLGLNDTVHGNALIGARIFFDFSDGTRTEGFLRAVTGMPSASTYVTERVIQSGVPEPATWAMLIAGFGLVGGAIRARRGQALAA